MLTVVDLKVSHYTCKGSQDQCVSYVRVLNNTLNLKAWSVLCPVSSSWQWSFEMMCLGYF